MTARGDAPSLGFSAFSSLRTRGGRRGCGQLNSTLGSAGPSLWSVRVWPDRMWSLWISCCAHLARLTASGSGRVCCGEVARESKHRAFIVL